MTMRIKTVIMALLLLITAGAKAQNYEEVPGDPMKARIYTLSNGLKVYLSVNKEKPRVQCYIAVRTGSRNDPPETTGLAHYLEHLMFKGTNHFGTSDPVAERPYLDSIRARYEYYRTLTNPQQRKQCYHKIDSLSQLAARYNIPNEYDKMMTAIGAEGTNAYTSNDVTCYTDNIPANEIENYLKVQGDRFQNMVIRGFHTELEAVYEEYNIGLANDDNKVFTALMAKLFPKHPYGTQTTIGRGEHLKNPSIVNIENYFKRYYVPNNVAICMAGDLDPDKVMALVHKYFDSWQPSRNLSRPEYGPQPAITAPIDTTVVGQEAESVVMGWRFPAANSAACDTLDILTAVLYNGRAGMIDLNLNQKLKIQGGYAGNDELNDYSMFIMGGQPNQGQTIEQVRQLLLDELQKLRRGEFSDDLLESIINNQKRDFYQAMLSNQWRANRFVSAFIDNIAWDKMVGWLDRVSKLTKQDIVNFANRYLLDDNFVCVYKRQGVDSTLKKVEKPAITPIPTNNDKSSKFLNEVVNAKVEPIQPVFTNFDRDITKSEIKKTKMPLLYIQNKTDGLFTLQFRYKDLGQELTPLYGYAADYADILGTKTMTNEQLKQQFYKLACDYSISQGGSELYVTLQGLSENMKEALQLLSTVITDIQPDTAAYSRYVSVVEKNRQDNRANQQANFSTLTSYGMYGKYNNLLSAVTVKELKKMNPDKLLDYLRDLANHTPTLLYFGPMTQKQLAQSMSKLGMLHNNNVKLPQHQIRKFKMQPTNRNEVLMAEYDAKNTYMVGFYDNEVKSDDSREPIIRLFNEYFSGSMNSLVFQEVREARGLAYSAFATYDTPWRREEPECFYTYAITQTDKLPDCIKEFHELIDSMPERPQLFELAKQSLLKSIATSRTTRFGTLSYYWNQQRLGRNYDIDSLVYYQVPKITLPQLVEFERQYIANKPCRYIILGKEADMDMKFLEKLGPITKLKQDDFMIK